MNVRAFKLRPVAEILRSGAVSRLSWGALASIPGLAFAGPTGENVVAGAAVVHRPSVTHTQIDQSTQNAVVNWSTFSVGSDEYVIFNQPGATASILNRVTGSAQSKILGQMQANGRVFLVNPQGVYFAPGAKVDVGALTASVLDIANDDFMSGKYVFTRPAGAPDGATVENAGEIKVGDGGYVVLAGDYANNTGVISARLGTVVLAAGSRMTLDLSEDGLVSFAVDEATMASLAGVNNAGQIYADGGQVIMTAKVANDLVATAVNNDGLLQAHRIVEDGGEVYLSAAGGDIVHAGSIDVAGASGQSGGEVGITGDADITLTADSSINANGDGAGNGGTVNVIADGTLAFRRDAEITAIAGASGERGGRVELSGHEGLQMKGDVVVGAGGELVIDPAVWTLVNSAYGGSSYGSSSSISVSSIENQLNSGADVILIADTRIDASPSVTDVTALGPLVGGAPPPGDLTFRISDSNGDIMLSGVEINILGNFIASAGTATGDVYLGKVTGNNVILAAGSLAGNIILDSGGVSAASTNMTLTAADDITIGTPAKPGGLTLTGSGFVGLVVNAGGNVKVEGDITASDTSFFGNAIINVVAGGGIEVGDVTGTAGGTVSVMLNAAAGDVKAGEVEATVGSAGTNATIIMSAGNDIIADGVEAYGDGGEGAGVFLNAVNDIRVLNEIEAAVGTSGTYGGPLGPAMVSAIAGNDIIGDEVIAYGETGANVFLSAGNDIVFNGVESAVGVSGSPASGNALLTVFTSNDATLGDVEVVTGAGLAAAVLQVGNDLAIDKTEMSGSTASFGATAKKATFSEKIEISGGLGGSVMVAVQNSVAVQKGATISGGAGAATFSIGQVFPGTGGGATAMVDVDGTVAVSGAFANVGFAGKRVDVDGPVNVIATAGAASFQAGASLFSFGGSPVGVTVNLNKAINVTGNGALFGVSGENVAVKGAVNVNGMTGPASFGVNAFAGVMDFGSPFALGAGAVGVAGAVTVTGGGAVGVVAGGNVGITGPVNITATLAGSVTGLGAGAIFVGLAQKNLAVPGKVTVKGAGKSTAAYAFGKNAVFGQQRVTAGGGKTATVSVGNIEGLFEGPAAGFGASVREIVGDSAKFNAPVSAVGSAVDMIKVDVRNSILTTDPGGVLIADKVMLGVSNTGTTTIDVNTQTPMGLIRNTGMTPNVIYDNRAFAGASMVDFGSGTVIKSGTFFATGPLQFSGPLAADRLAVAVTNGDVTFGGPVHITGANPFLPTAPDGFLYSLMTTLGLPTPTHGPNVQIIAQNGINMNKTFHVGGATPYTKMYTNGAFNISGLTTSADNMLAVFSPIDTTRPIFFSDVPFSQPLGTSGFFNFPTIQGLPDTGGVTVVLGELRGPVAPVLSSPVTIGFDQRPIDLGDRNMLIITRGSVTGEDFVTTNGVFELVPIVGTEFFNVPVIDEFTEEPADEDEDEDEDVLLSEEGESNGDETDLSEDSGSESMECS